MDFTIGVNVGDDGKILINVRIPDDEGFTTRKKRRPRRPPPPPRVVVSPPPALPTLSA